LLIGPATDYKPADLGVDSSIHFPSRARTHAQTDTQTDATERSTHTTATAAGVVNKRRLQTTGVGNVYFTFSASLRDGRFNHIDEASVSGLGLRGRVECGERATWCTA